MTKIPVGQMREVAQLYKYDINSDTVLPREEWCVVIRHDVAYRDADRSAVHQFHILHRLETTFSTDDIAESEYEHLRELARDELAKLLPGDTPLDVTLLPLPAGIKIARYV